MSFGWTFTFRRGAWNEFRRFALLQRQNVPDRVIMIDKELNRLGSVSILYQRKDIENPQSDFSELRKGITVTEGTTLDKLFKAYIARGGNPFDISMFLTPDSYKITDEGIYIEKQPYGGVIAPSPSDDDELFVGVDTSGWLPILKYIPRKLGNKGNYWTAHGHTIGTKIEASREWITQEIKELRNDLEARIIKICDLREQLLTERFELLSECVGQATQGVELQFDPTYHSEEYHLLNIIKFIDNVYYNSDSKGLPDRSSPREDDPNRPYPVLLGDASSGAEKFTAL